MLRRDYIGEFFLALAVICLVLIFALCASSHESPRSGKWPAVERAHLKAQPECQACGSRELLSVHHIRPFRLYPELELDADNLITLCQKHHCHFLFGHAGDYRAWN